MLEIGAPHPRAQLDEVLVRVDDRALDDLRGLRVVAALVQGHPPPANQPVLPGLLKRETLWNHGRNPTAHTNLDVSYTPSPTSVKKAQTIYWAYVQVGRWRSWMVT